MKEKDKEPPSFPPISRSAKTSRDKDEPISFPLLQPFPQPMTNYSSRCKRTKALQIQNKRSKEVNLSLSKQT